MTESEILYRMKVKRALNIAKHKEHGKTKDATDAAKIAYSSGYRDALIDIIINISKED